MPKRRNLTLYRLRDKVEGKPSNFKNVLRSTRGLKIHNPAKPPDWDFSSQLVISISNAEVPGWTDFFDGSFGGLKVPKVKRVDGLLLVQVNVAGEDPIFAFSFGQGRHLLKPEAIMPSHGLEVALNAMYLGTDARNQVRSVDSKTIGGSVFNTRKQADRSTTFDAFSVDTQRDLLRNIVGRPSDPKTWGTRLSGSSGLNTNPEIDFGDLGKFCRKVFRTHLRGTPSDFSWVEKLRLVVELKLKADLLERVAKDFSKSDALSLAPPELIEWDKIDYFSLTCLPGDQFHDPEDIDLAGKLSKLKKPKNISVPNLRKWKLEAFDHANSKLHSWPLVRCISGQLKRNGETYIFAEGEFYRVDDKFLNDLDEFVHDIEETKHKLPIAEEDPPEGEYNELAANSSDDYLLMDKKMIKITSQTSPIEACDILSIDGAFIHVKRKLGSSSLSHLFAQGSVSADLLLMSEDYKTELDKKILEAEKNREKASKNASFKEKFPRFSEKATDPKEHEIVYAVAADWKKRTLADALPFFSKINLRRHKEDLTRMGYRVTFAKIPTTPRK